MFHLSQLSFIIFLTALLILTVQAIPSNVWHISILQGPAPPPEKGPPVSASALRDLSFLPVQIGSIVGAYILSVIAIGIALLLVGRRLRRAAQSSPLTLAMQMMRPTQSNTSNVFDPSPISPTANNPYSLSPNSTIDMKSSTWPSPEKTKSGTHWPSIGKGHKKQTSMQSSVVTFDESVIEDDRVKNQQEMDRLYAAVVEHDIQRSTSRLDLADKQTPQSPPELQHLRSSSAYQQPTSAVSRAETKSPSRTLTVSPRQQTRPSPLTIHSRASSRSSFGSFGKKRSIRNLPISPPMGSPELASNHGSMYGDSEPLSPRFYDPGPPPPTPPVRQHDSIPEDGYEPFQQQSPRSAESSEYNHAPFQQQGPRRAEASDYNHAPRTSIPTIRTAFEGSATRPPVQPSRSDNDIPLRELTKHKRTPAPLALRTNNGSSAPPGQQFPLRSAPLPLRNPRTLGYTSERPPSTIKATVLERKLPEHRIPGTPRTGVPQTPYSPYMPFTPLTPITPSRLVTKQERKRREKEDGRRVATIDDAVEEEADMWGSGYP